MFEKDMTTAYWKVAIDDYISCCSEEIKLTEQQKENIVKKLLNDDQMWKEIDATIDFYINKERNKENE